MINRCLNLSLIHRAPLFIEIKNKVINKKKFLWIFKSHLASVEVEQNFWFLNFQIFCAFIPKWQTFEKKSSLEEGLLFVWIGGHKF